MKAFLDTNILVYATLSDDPRRPVAEHVLLAGGVISAQVANEFVNVARTKLKWSWEEVDAAIALMAHRIKTIVPLTIATNAAARRLARDHGLAFYDALIVASALETGCDTLWSEDMQHGRTIGRVTIRNPFLEGSE